MVKQRTLREMKRAVPWSLASEKGFSFASALSAEEPKNSSTALDIKET
jgi:hypothetical protein